MTLSASFKNMINSSKFWFPKLFSDKSIFFKFLTSFLLLLITLNNMLTPSLESLFPLKSISVKCSLYINELLKALTYSSPTFWKLYSNFSLSPERFTNPKGLGIIFSSFVDLIKANKGVLFWIKYFLEKLL